MIGSVAALPCCVRDARPKHDTRARRWVITAFLGLVVSAGTLTAQAEDTSAADTSRADERIARTALLATGAYVASGIVVMENTWYRDRALVPFHFFDDSRAYLQADKFGHAFGAYAQSYLGYHWLQRRGVSRSRSLVYGGGLGIFLQTPIEVMDGIHEGWGFSWGDMAANAAGSTLVVGQELLLGEQVVKYKFSYWESPYAATANGFLGSTTLERILEDYNGHTYWLSMPLQRIGARRWAPPWLGLAVGYSVNGVIGELENIAEHRGFSIPQTTRYRQYLLSLDVDWTGIDTESPVLRAVFTGLTFVKLPFPALELSSEGGVRGYWLYF
jgi:uncharacterized protein YfiM (DUF2279 family)